MENRGESCFLPVLKRERERPGGPPALFLLQAVCSLTAAGFVAMMVAGKKELAESIFERIEGKVDMCETMYGCR